MPCSCFIIPNDVLTKLSKDKSLKADLRKRMVDTVSISHELRELRTQALKLTSVAAARSGGLVQLAAAPAVTVYDCKTTQTLPGSPIAKPKTSSDASAKRAVNQTSKVAQFYKQVFNRNSIDDQGMTMMSSIHYGVKYNNAMWNGSQMVYGDGDGSIFIDFTKGNDVIGHELTHGVTQHSLQLVYSGDAGGLNESISDCFGSMFRQWSAKQTVNKADWLIGRDIMGAGSKKKGYTCLRDMANPAAKHCLAPQPTKYSQVTPGMDPHYSSGPPNLAFCTACKTMGGNSWNEIGQVWYNALTSSGPSPNMTMKAFAARTRQAAHTLYPTKAAVYAAVNAGWTKVGL